MVPLFDPYKIRWLVKQHFTLNPAAPRNLCLPAQMLVEKFSPIVKNTGICFSLVQTIFLGVPLVIGVRVVGVCSVLALAIA